MFFLLIERILVRGKFFHRYCKILQYVFVEIGRAIRQLREERGKILAWLYGSEKLNLIGKLRE